MDWWLPELPVLFISGMDDPCYINEKKWNQAMERMRSLGYEDITEIRYKGMRHELHNEKECEKVFKDIEKFCNRIMETFSFKG